jgi:hypothetical protein
MNETNSRKNGRRWRIRVGLITTLVGLLTFIIGMEPGLLGLNRSAVFGFVQIAVFLVGLAIICLGGFIALNTLWNGMEKSIAADIGFRLVATGYVIAVASALADVFGIGSQSFPAVPYFGPWQASGLIFGEVFIAIGFLMLIPFSSQKQ